MATLVLRSVKGTPLTNDEVDANFTNLNTAKAELAGAAFTGPVSATQFTGPLSGNATNVTGTVAIANGGTGAVSASAALTALGAQPALGYTPYNSSNPAGYITSAGTAANVTNLPASQITGSLGYTPVQQGTGVGQGANIVKIGWVSASGGLKVTVDTTDQGFFPMSTTGPGTFSYSGAIVATGNVTAFSDARFKTNWRFLSTDFVEQLATVQSGVFDRTDISETQVGVSAQSLQKVIPEAVVENENGFLSVAYGNAAMVACIELAKRVVELEARLAKVEGK